MLAIQTAARNAIRMNESEVKSVFKSFQESYQSIDLELAIAFIDESWKAVFAKAILSALKPSFVSVLVDTELFKLLKGRLSIDLFEQLYKILSEGGQLNLDVDSLGIVNVYFAGWTMSYVAYEYGNLARNIWKEIWPVVRCDFGSETPCISGKFEERVNILTKSHALPFRDFAEAIRDEFDMSDDLLQIKRNGKPQGHLLIPILAAFQSIQYVRQDDKLQLRIQVKYHPSILPENLEVSAIVDKKDGTVNRLRRMPLKGKKTILSDEHRLIELLREVEAKPEEIKRVTAYLVLQGFPEIPSVLDELHMDQPLDVVPEQFVAKLVREEERRGVREARYLAKLEKRLMEGKGKDFEDAVMELFLRAGFDVARKDPEYDLLACCPQGIFAIECTSDLISKSMIDKLIDVTDGLKGSTGKYVKPVIFTNQMNSGDLDPAMKSMVTTDKLFICARDEILRLFDRLSSERSARTAAFSRFLKW